MRLHGTYKGFESKRYSFVVQFRIMTKSHVKSKRKPLIAGIQVFFLTHMFFVEGHRIDVLTVIEVGRIALNMNLLGNNAI